MTCPEQRGQWLEKQPSATALKSPVGLGNFGPQNIYWLLYSTLFPGLRSSFKKKKITISLLAGRKVTQKSSALNTWIFSWMKSSKLKREKRKKKILWNYKLRHFKVLVCWHHSNLTKTLKCLNLLIFACLLMIIQKGGFLAWVLQSSTQQISTAWKSKNSRKVG